jgi:hypothetical protein
MHALGYRCLILTISSLTRERCLGIIDLANLARYPFCMDAVEFTAELSGSTVLQIPSEAAARLPKAGRARVIVLTDEENEEAEWSLGAYAQFLRGNSTVARWITSGMGSVPA